MKICQQGRLRLVYRLDFFFLRNLAGAPQFDDTLPAGQVRLDQVFFDGLSQSSRSFNSRIRISGSFGGVQIGDFGPLVRSMRRSIVWRTACVGNFESHGANVSLG